MRNPLTKRIPREFVQDGAKYFVIFAFMVLLISIISGFLVTDDSVEHTYKVNFKEKKIEDGHISFKKEVPKEVLSEIEKKTDIQFYEYHYFEENLKDDTKNVRVYSTKRDINLLSVMSGKLPKTKDEIAFDRMFAVNNKIKVGDTVALGGKKLKVTGLIASPDYSCLFENNSDMMFDSINFSIAVMSEAGFKNYDSKHITYSYAWLYPKFIERTDTKTANDKSDTVMDAVEEVVKNYDNQLIDDAVRAGKLMMLSEMLHKLSDTLSLAGQDLSMFDNDAGYQTLLDQINGIIKQENIDLSQELSDGNRNVTLSVDDIKTAMNASEKDVDAAKKLVEQVEDQVVEVKDYLPRYLNQAINFTGNDMGSDRASIILFDYIITLVLAFVFAITTSNTIVTEAGVIGTLRASGYTRGELLRHYMVLPVFVSLFAAIVGNILGYTVLTKYVEDIYYMSYSLAPYKALWNLDAFILTTAIPLVIMIVINFFVLASKLKLSPLRFLRHDLSKRGKKKAFRLNTKIPFIQRFRMRIIFQNIPNYITLFCGIYIGGSLVVFSLMYAPMMKDYKKLALKDRICDYQYVMKEQVETTDSDAEKYLMTSLKTTNSKFKEDEISIYGIEENSKYIDAKVADGSVIVSNSIAEKFKLKKGDTLNLKSGYDDQTYEFKIGGVVTYNTALAVFMNRKEYIKNFHVKTGEFTGYFSNHKLSDISSDDVASIITVEDLTKVSDQMIKSMGGMMVIFTYVGVIIFALLMFIMSKQIIEKNSNSISMTKILGFYNREIGGLYIVATSIIVIISLLLVIPLVSQTIKLIFTEYLYTEITGYFAYSVRNSCYITMVLLGIVSYAFVAMLQLFKISRISKSDALKNVE